MCDGQERERAARVVARAAQQRPGDGVESGGMRAGEDQPDQVAQAAGSRSVSAVTTHVLDTMRGEPASGVVVRLERAGEAELELGRGTTNADGRISDFGVASLSAGTYRLVFETAAYLQ